MPSTAFNGVAPKMMSGEDNRRARHDYPGLRYRSATDGFCRTKALAEALSLSLVAYQVDHARLSKVQRYEAALEQCKYGGPIHPRCR
jgi:hypothetical protein